MFLGNRKAWAPISMGATSPFHQIGSPSFEAWFHSTPVLGQTPIEDTESGEASMGEKVPCRQVERGLALSPVFIHCIYCTEYAYAE